MATLRGRNELKSKCFRERRGRGAREHGSGEVGGAQLAQRASTDGCHRLPAANSDGATPVERACGANTP